MSTWFVNGEKKYLFIKFSFPAFKKQNKNDILNKYAKKPICQFVRSVKQVSNTVNKYLAIDIIILKGHFGISIEVTLTYIIFSRGFWPVSARMTKSQFIKSKVPDFQEVRTQLTIIWFEFPPFFTTKQAQNSATSFNRLVIFSCYLCLGLQLY